MSKQPMSAERLSEIRKRNEDRTPGTWAEDDCNIFSREISDLRHKLIMEKILHGVHFSNEEFAKEHGYRCGECPGHIASCGQDYDNCDANADFIAHAPADITRLLAEVDRLNAELQSRLQQTDNKEQ